MYLLDSNVFIQAKNLHYGFDFCPAFWELLVKEHHNQKISSIDKVKDEISIGDDELATWINHAQLRNFFMPTDAQTVMQFNTINDWINNKGYEQFAIFEFMQAADYYLIAQAKQRNATIVTHEIPSDSLGKIKISNVCIGLNINFMTPFLMLKQLQAKFILQ